jgi:hypothetical protein
LAFALTLAVILATDFFADLAFAFGTSFGFGRGFADVLPRDVVLGYRVFVIVFAIDYPR